MYVYEIWWREQTEDNFPFETIITNKPIQNKRDAFNRLNPLCQLIIKSPEAIQEIKLCHGRKKIKWVIDKLYEIFRYW